jgi:Flp pilus assembly pilin Flp
MTRLIASFVRDERGAIQVEYSLLAGLLGAVVALGLVALGDAMDGAYEPIAHVRGGDSRDLPGAVAP